MKKILNALFLTLLTVFTFSSCSDVPSPYDILGEGDVPGLTGDGTKENPYDIASAQQKQDGSIAWVQGYIVGTIENYTDASGSAKFAAPFTAKNNLLIAASETETNIKNCVVVQLVSGTDLYTKLNLVDNADANLHKILSIQGSLEKFYGFPGVKSTTAATLDGKDVGGSDIPTDEDNPFGLDASNPLNEIKADFEEQPDFVQDGTYNSNLNYDYALDGWKNIAFVGDRKWTGVVFKDNAKYIQASANKGAAATYTSWFISPAFTVDNIKDKTIAFDCAGAYYYETTTLKVYFLELVDGVMQKTEIPVAGIPTSGSNFVWTKGLEIKLDSYSGKIGFIGFEYVAEGGASKSTTYQIDNIKSGKSEGGGETPGEGTELLTNGGFENWADGYPSGWKSASTASSATLEQSTDKRSGTFAVLVKGASSNKQLGSAEMTLKAGTYVFSAYFKAATADKASACLGYVPVGADGTIGGSDYKYDDYVNDITNAEWVTKSYTFTLTGEQKICLVVMNPKSSGKDLLIDDASLMTNDGGIVGGTEEPEPSSGELFISEYVEGSSNNKYIEIYNPAGQTVDLSGYRLDIAANGKEWSYGDAKYDNSVDLSGKTLASHATMVFKHKQATLYKGEAFEASFVNFNGDDAIGLFKNGSLIDIVGEKGSTNKYGENKTFRRKASVKTPNPVFSLDEWEELAIDEISGLGSHIME